MFPTIFPLQAFLIPLVQNPWTYLVFGLIGFAFGFVLELSGFGNSKKLAAQFYFKDLTVLKVMFGAIVTAMVLLFLSSALGILDYNLVYVPETHLWPGLLGGLIMGVGFIIGGFCPGTALVSASTLKVDGIVFSLGVLTGVWAFGETVQPYWEWWNNSGYYGRLTLMDVFRLPTGVVVLLVVLMALFMFWGAEQLERIFGKKDIKVEPKLRYAGAAALLAIAVAVLVLGQPTPTDKYANLLLTREVDGKQVQVRPDDLLADRQVQIHPGELLASLGDQKLNVLMFDVRNEADYNLFHITGSQRIPLTDVPSLVPDLLSEQSGNTLIVLIDNDETAATKAWKVLIAESVPNLYILEGGINNWITVFGEEEVGIHPIAAKTQTDRLSYTFDAALGDQYAAAHPLPHEWADLEYTPKVKLQRKRSPSGGGCG